MRKHCFFCWNDATHVWDDATHSALEVCRDHAPENAPILLIRQTPGMGEGSK